MNFRPFALLLLLAGLAQSDPADDARYVARVLTKVEEGVAKAREHRERPDWYVQCAGDLHELEEAVTRLPEAERAPYTAKITALRPEIEGGVRLSRGLYVARSISRNIDSARADLPRVAIDPTILEKLDQLFADPDAKGIPAEQLKVLQADFAALKKENAARPKP